MPSKQKQRKNRQKNNLGSNPGLPNGFSQRSTMMDSKRELLQDCFLVPYSQQNNGNITIQAGVNELVYNDSGDSSTGTYQYGTSTSQFQFLADFWVTYAMESVSITITLFGNWTGLAFGPFFSAIEAAELDTMLPSTIQEFAAAATLMINTSTAQSITRKQVFTKFLQQNLPNEYLNTMAATVTQRELYPTTGSPGQYARTPVIQILFPYTYAGPGNATKFIAAIQVNTVYKFRGRRTTFPIQKTISQKMILEKDEEDPVVSFVDVPISIVHSRDQNEIEALKKRIAALESSSVACANGE